jgi:hypothetical protein
VTYRCGTGVPARVHRFVTLTLVVVLAGGCGPDAPTTVGADAAQRLASPTPDAPAPSVPVNSGAIKGDQAASVQPSSLRIDRIGLTARVVAVGIDAKTGDFDVPERVDTVGWYRYGPGLDATVGSVVLAGHVDSAAQGKGAFFRLDEIGPGDRIAVTGTDAVTRTFTVIAREVYRKRDVPLDRYFARDGAMRLTLITCGGPFDERARSYRDNVVVTAVPV